MLNQYRLYKGACCASDYKSIVQYEDIISYLSNITWKDQSSIHIKNGKLVLISDGLGEIPTEKELRHRRLDIDSLLYDIKFTYHLLVIICQMMKRDLVDHLDLIVPIDRIDTMGLSLRSIRSIYPDISIGLIADKYMDSDYISGYYGVSLIGTTDKPVYVTYGTPIPNIQGDIRILYTMFMSYDNMYYTNTIVDHIDINNRLEMILDFMEDQSIVAKHKILGRWMLLSIETSTCQRKDILLERWKKEYAYLYTDMELDMNPILSYALSLSGYYDYILATLYYQMLHLPIPHVEYVDYCRSAIDLLRQLWNSGIISAIGDKLLVYGNEQVWDMADIPVNVEFVSDIDKSTVIFIWKYTEDTDITNKHTFVNMLDRRSPSILDSESILSRTTFLIQRMDTRHLYIGDITESISSPTQIPYLEPQRWIPDTFKIENQYKRLVLGDIMPNSIEKVDSPWGHTSRVGILTYTNVWMRDVSFTHSIYWVLYPEYRSMSIIQQAIFHTEMETNLPIYVIPEDSWNIIEYRNDGNIVYEANDPLQYRKPGIVLIKDTYFYPLLRHNSPIW